MSKKSYRYDVSSDEWHELPDTPKDHYSMNLVPFAEHRFILFVACPTRLIFDTKYEQWILIE